MYCWAWIFIGRSSEFNEGAFGGIRTWVFCSHLLNDVMTWQHAAKLDLSNNGCRGVPVLWLVYLIVEAIEMLKKMVLRSLVQVADRLSSVPNPVRQHCCSEVWLGEQCHLYHFCASACTRPIIWGYNNDDYLIGIGFLWSFSHEIEGSIKFCTPSRLRNSLEKFYFSFIFFSLG